MQHYKTVETAITKTSIYRKLLLQEKKKSNAFEFFMMCRHFNITAILASIMMLTVGTRFIKFLKVT